jgi:hypothetical protein
LQTVFEAATLVINFNLILMPNDIGVSLVLVLIMLLIGVLIGLGFDDTGRAMGVFFL